MSFLVPIFKLSDDPRLFLMYVMETTIHAIRLFVQVTCHAKLFWSNQPSFMQPVEETSVMQPSEEKQVDGDQNDAFRVDEQVTF
jgi:hypothetical protein